jgi:protein O-GlcNAc transferase
VNRLLASAYRRLERDELAEAALGRSMAAAGPPQWFDPVSAELAALEINAQTQLQRAKALVEQGYISQAFRLFESLLQKYPERTSIHLAYAAALSERGQLDSAIDLLESALEKHPQSAAVHVNLGAAYLTKARLQPPQRRAMLERAATHASAAIDADPAFGAPHALRGEVLEELGQSQQAVMCYQHAIARDPDGAQWRFLAGRAWSTIGDHAQAAAALEQAVHLAPRHGEAWYLLARAYMQLDQPASANAALSNAQRWLGLDDERVATAARALARLRSDDVKPARLPEQQP